MSMMDFWALLWIIVCFTILISILESLHRREKERRRREEQEELEQQIRAQQYRVYTLQSFNGQGTTAGMLGGVVMSPYHAQLKVYDDLPPKYEDVVIGIPAGSASVPNSATLSTVQTISATQSAPAGQAILGIPTVQAVQTVRNCSLQRQGTF